VELEELEELEELDDDSEDEEDDDESVELLELADVESELSVVAGLPPPQAASSIAIRHRSMPRSLPSIVTASCVLRQGWGSSLLQ
jgi:hypothetical protein